MIDNVGVEFNTFSIIGRCARTGMLGIAITTSDIAVGSRCPHVQPLIGAVSTQAVTDPRLGTLAVRLMQLGYSANRAIHELEASDPHIERRQLGSVDRDGNSAARTGSSYNSWAGHIANRDYVAMGNGLSGEQVVNSMGRAFEDAASENLEERLLRSLDAGQSAGGEARDSTPYHSAALLVYDQESFARVDLRVDEHALPIGELRRLLEIYIPKILFYNLRATDPDNAGI